MTFSSKGISVVEIIIGVSILSLIVMFVLHTSVLFLKGAETVREKTKALYLAEEGMEILKYLRSENWDNLANLTPDQKYYLAVSTTTILTTTSNEVIDESFQRDFWLESAYRNNDDDLVASTTAGATMDTGSRWAHVRVINDGHSVTLSSLLVNLSNP